MSENLDRYLLVPNPDSPFFAPLDTALEGCAPELLDIGRAFRRNLEGVIRVISLPYRIAHLCLWPDLGVEVRQRLGKAWSVPTPEGSGIADILKAKVDALRRDSEILESEVFPGFASKVKARALEALGNDLVLEGVRDLLRQGLVLSWVALEVVARDTFVGLLNSHPRLTGDLIKSQRTKKLFAPVHFDLETLEVSGFDLSSSMGEFLADRVHLDSLDSLQAVFAALFPDHADLGRALHTPELYLVNKRRHLIVHRRGVVDDQYARRTSDTLTRGTVLPIRREELLEAIEAVRNPGTEILKAASSRFLNGCIASPPSAAKVADEMQEQG